MTLNLYLFSLLFNNIEWFQSKLFFKFFYYFVFWLFLINSCLRKYSIWIQFWLQPLHHPCVATKLRTRGIHQIVPWIISWQSLLRTFIVSTIIHDQYLDIYNASRTDSVNDCIEAWCMCMCARVYWWCAWLRSGLS